MKIDEVEHKLLLESRPSKDKHKLSYEYLVMQNKILENKIKQLELRIKELEDKNYEYRFIISPTQWGL